MINLNPTLTAAGLALFADKEPGYSVVLTAIGFGGAKYDPTGDETNLQSELARYPVDGGAVITSSTIQVGVLMTNIAPNGASPNNNWIGEIGFYVGATLFAVLSHAVSHLFYKSPDIDVPVTYILDFSLLPPGSVTVNNDALSDSISLAASYAQTAAKTSVDTLVVIKNSHYGSYAVGPVARPDGTPRQKGDRYFDTVVSAEMTWMGNSWFVANIDAARLAQEWGSALVGHHTGTVKDALDNLLEHLTALDQGQNAGVIGHDTLAHLNADLDHPEKTIAYVTNDPTPENNTTWRKVGAIGAGSWVISSSSPVDLVKTMLLGMLSITNEKAATLSSYVKGILEEPAEVPFAITDPDGNAALTISETGVVQVVELRAHEALSVQEIGIDSNDQARFSVTDEEGSALLMLTDDELRVLALTLGKAGATIDAGDAPFEIVDDAGSSALRVETDGSVSSKTLNVANQFRFPGEVRPAVIPADITMVIAYGQSWAVGFENQAVSLVSRFPNLMFNGGVRTQCVSDDPAVSMNAFAPLVERQDDHTPEFPAFPGGVGESTGTGSAEMVSELLQAENNITHANARCQFLVTAPGEGSKSIEGLSDGSDCFTRLKKQILAGYQLAQAAGRTFAVGAVTWVQGGSYGPNQAYPAQLEALRVAVDSYAKSVTGQVQDVELITWQSFPLGGAGSIDEVYWRHVVGLDQYPHIHTAGPSYFFDNSYYNADGTTGTLHFNGLSSKWLAGYLGLAMKRVICDGQDWQPLRPTRLLRQGRLCSIDFHVPVGSLVADTTRFHAQPNLGFNLYASNGAELPLASAAIAGRATVVLQAVDVIPAGAFVRYGGVQSEWGRHTGSGGNLRDTQGDLITFDGGGFNLPMHNWCVVFNEVISN